MSASSDSAGFLVFRRGAAGPEVLLVHPGGPYWRGKEGARMVVSQGAY